MNSLTLDLKLIKSKVIKSFNNLKGSFRKFFSNLFGLTNENSLIQISKKFAFLRDNLIDFFEKKFVPKKYIYGVGLGNHNKWYIGAQIEKRVSSNFENRFLNIKNIDYRDSESFSIGGSYIPEYSSLTSIWKRTVYRFGVKSEKKSIIVNNLPINQFSLNLGVGLPLSGLSKANIGLEFGQIGEENNLIVKENYWSIRLGLSLNDIWFIRRKYN